MVLLSANVIVNVLTEDVKNIKGLTPTIIPRRRSKCTSTLMRKAVFKCIFGRNIFRNVYVFHHLYVYVLDSICWYCF